MAGCRPPFSLLPMKRKYTTDEVELFKELCNFTQNERIFFELWLKNKSYTSISFRLSVSESQVSIISKKVFSKIDRVRHFL